MTTSTLNHPSTSQRQDQVPWAKEMILVAQQGRSFKTRELLQRIVIGEQQRIREEQMLWRIGGALLGACLGLGDGFQPVDIFLSTTMSHIAGQSHELMSDADRRFLESCQSLWTVGVNSPMELQQRLGPARSRLLLYCPDWQQPVLCSHHQGHRGDTLVPLECAQRLAAGFQLPQSLEVMQRHFTAEELEVVGLQLYPDASHAMAVGAIRPITAQQAMALDPAAPVFLPATQPVQVEIQGQPVVAYRVDIPAHSDF